MTRLQVNLHAHCGPYSRGLNSTVSCPPNLSMSFHNAPVTKGTLAWKVGSQGVQIMTSAFSLQRIYAMAWASVLVGLNLRRQALLPSSARSTYLTRSSSERLLLHFNHSQPESHSYAPVSQYWRLFTNHLIFGNSSELLLALVLLYNIGINIERTFGSRKYGVRE